MRMMKRAWRTLITLSCFAIFGIGGTILSATIFPLLIALPSEKEDQQRRARMLIGFFFRSLVSVLERTGCMRLHATRTERLKDSAGTLILANHPTYIDVVVLLSLNPQANCVVKSALWRNPFYWGIVRAAGYIRNDNPESTIYACAECLRRGESIVIFPEGTRTRPGGSLRFLRGVARIALQANPIVLPVLIHCDPPTLTKADPFWKVPNRAFDFRLKALAPLPASTFYSGSAEPAISARHFTTALQNFFSQELVRHGFA